MLSRLSHPLAFATAPLDGTSPDFGGESFFVVGEETAQTMGDTIVPITRSMAGTMLEDRSQRNPNSTGIPFREQRGAKTLEEYAVENRQLKIAVDQLS